MSIFEINIEDEIKFQKDCILNMKKNCNITDEQVDIARKLCNIYDDNNISNGRHRWMVLFKEMAELLNFNYRDAMAIVRMEKIVEILEETLKRHGSVVYTEWGEDSSKKYYAINSEKWRHGTDVFAYVWNDIDKVITNIEECDFPYEFEENEDISKLIELMKTKNFK